MNAQTRFEQYIEHLAGGLGHADRHSGLRAYCTGLMLPLTRNPRAKMQGVREGFVKLFVAAGSGTILGAVMVGPRASESVYPLTIAVAHRLTADQLSAVSTVYPSLSGTTSEVARILHQGPGED